VQLEIRFNIGSEIRIGSEEWKNAFQKSRFRDDLQFARTPGPILLQDFGKKVKFRKMRVREIMETDIENLEMGELVRSEKK